MKHPYCSSARLQRSGPPVADGVRRPWEGQHQPRRPQFWSASYSTAGGKEQQGGEAMCCFHVLSGSTRDRPKCPDVLVVSLPRRAHHHRFAMISASHWKLPTIPARLPRKKLQLRQKGLPYPSLRGIQQQQMHPGPDGCCSNMGYREEGLWKQLFPHFAGGRDAVWNLGPSIQLAGCFGADPIEAVPAPPFPRGLWC